MWSGSSSSSLKNIQYSRGPSVVLPSVSVWSFVCQSFCNGRELALLAILRSVPRISSGGIATLHVHGVVLSSSFDNLNRFCKDVGSFLIFIFIFVFLRMCPALSASAVDGLFRMLQANKTLSCSDCFAKFRTVRYCPILWACTLDTLSCFKSSMMDLSDFRLAVYHQNLRPLSPVLRPCGCRLVSSYDSPRTRRSIWNELSSFVALFRIGASDCLANSFSLLFWNNLLLLLMPSSSRQYVP